MDLRDEYMAKGLRRPDLDLDPFRQFRIWFDAAAEARLWDHDAMVLSTVDDEGWPSARYVLLRGFGRDGFVFYTNYTSDKARALDDNGRASLTFGWLELRRQVRVVGVASRVSAEVSDAYFASRERGSQLGAWASDQSAVIPSRVILDDARASYEERFADGEVPRPPHWGGYQLRPMRFEFWQGREDRLHDRFAYRAVGDEWVIERLSP